jgi:large subunit ribosomal protein L28
MSQVCEYTGKRPSTGHNVSHSNRKTKRRFLPNLFDVKLVDPETGSKFKARVSAKAIRIFNKNQSELLKFARTKRKQTARRAERLAKRMAKKA